MEAEAWLIWQQFTEPTTRLPTDRPAPINMTGADLVPKTEHRLFVAILTAQGDAVQGLELYRRERWTDVIRLRGLQLATRWQPPDPEKRKGRR